LVNCEFMGSELEGVVAFPLPETGFDGKYFINLVIKSDDGRNLHISQAGGKQTTIKMPDGNPIYPQESDLHLFGDVKNQS